MATTTAEGVWDDTDECEGCEEYPITTKLVTVRTNNGPEEFRLCGACRHRSWRRIVRTPAPGPSEEVGR